jgi:hypothetical protein
LGVPSVFLLVVAILQVCLHIGGLLLALIMLISALTEAPNGGDPEGAIGGAAFILVCVLLAGIKDAVVISGVVAMRKGRNYRRALTGAWLSLMPDAGWLFALIAGIWCITVLNEQRVKRAFEDVRRRYEEDDDDF